MNKQGKSSAPKVVYSVRWKLIGITYFFMAIFGSFVGWVDTRTWAGIINGFASAMGGFSFIMVIGFLKAICDKYRGIW